MANPDAKHDSTLPADEATPLERPAGAAAAQATRAAPFTDADRYQEAGEVARGGLGRVVRARDQRLDRPVAVKKLLDGADERGKARFLREALVTARLQHPAIVPIYDAGRSADGEPFYAMKLVSGRSLAEVVADRPSLDARLALLPVIITVSEAMAYAHSENIIHRDLKPANVLVGPFGETVVIDWGLAKALDAPDDADPLSPYQVVISDLTVVGTVLGTPAYMPPEQAEGKPVGVAADVYAVGAILYYVLSGAAPYSGDDSQKVLQAVLQGPPLPLAARQSGIPRDLIAIADKAMAREPGMRYSSAKHLAEDLERFSAGQLVRAHEYSLPQRAARWLARRRAMVTLAALFLLALAGVGAESVRRVVRARNDAVARRDQLTLLQAHAALDSDPTAALAWIDRYPLEAAGWTAVPDLVFEALTRGVARHVLHAPDGQPVFDLALSPDGTLCASGEWTGAVRVWEVESGRLRATIRHTNDVNQVAFSRDGAWLASASADSTVKLWRVATGEVRTLVGHRDAVVSLAFSPDSTRLATASWDKSVRLWTLDGASRVLGNHEANVTAVAFSPDGQSVASAGWDGPVHLWPVGAGAARTFAGHIGRVVSIAFSPDGKHLASAGADGALRLWKAAGGAGRLVAQLEGGVTSMTFSPDGKRLAAGGVDQALHLYDLDGGGSRVITRQHGDVLTLAFSPDGSALAAGGVDGTIDLCDLGSGECQHLRGHDGAVWKLRISRDGRWLASCGKDRHVRIWRVQPLASRVIHTADALYHLAFSADGRFIATDGRDGNALLLDLESGQVRTLSGHRATVFAVAFSPDSRTLATASFDQTVRLWNVEGGEPRVLTGAASAMQSVSFSPDGKKVAAGVWDGAVLVWNLADGALTTLRGHTARTFSAQFSPDGKWLASNSQDTTARLWNLATGESRVLAGHTALIGRMSWSPDGRTLATAGFDGAVRLWTIDGASRRLDAGGGRLWDVVFSPDGKQVAAASEDGIARVWYVDGGAAPRLFRGHRATVRRVSFSPDSALLASCGEDGQVRLYDMVTGENRMLPGHRSIADSVGFTRDGAWVVSVGEDKTLRRWRLEALPHVPVGAAALRRFVETTTSARVGAGDIVLTP